MFFVMLQSRLGLLFQRVFSMAHRRWFLVLATAISAAFLVMWAVAIPDLLGTLRDSPVRMRGTALNLPESVNWMRYAGALGFITGALRMLVRKQFVWLVVVVLTSIVPVALIVYFVREWVLELRPPRDETEDEPLSPA